MNILITNNSLNYFGGTETATRAIAIELMRQGHNVTVYTCNIGEIARELEQIGIRCFSDLDDLKSHIEQIGGIQIVHAHHNTTTSNLVSVMPELPIVYTCHGILWFSEGILPTPECPFGEKQCLKHVAVSEEVANKMAEAGYTATVIRNSIDMNRFSPLNRPSETPARILFSTHKLSPSSKEVSVLDQAAYELGIKVVYLGYYFDSQTREVPSLINHVDAVLGYGRTALEGMSCGRPTIIYGHNGADGLVTENNYFELRKHNFSGRRYAEEWDVARMKEELKKCIPHVGEVSRHLIGAFHDIRVNIKKYVSLYEDAIRIWDSSMMGRYPAAHSLPGFLNEQPQIRDSHTLYI